MITKNDSTRDWRWRYSLAPTTLTSTGYRTYCTGTGTYTWGRAYMAGVHGWQIAITDKSADPSGTPGAQWIVTFMDPWGGGYSASGSGAALEYRVYLLDAHLAGACGIYGLTFTRLELRTWNGSTETTVYTATSAGDSGTYQEILNDDNGSCSAAVYFGPAPGYPSCPATIGGLTSYTVDAEASFSVGCEKYVSGAWVKYNIDLVQPAAIALTCPCTGTLDTISVVDQSWGVNVPAVYKDQLSYVLDFTQVCTCAAPGGSSYNVPVYKLTRQLEYRSGSFSVKDKLGPVRTHQIDRYRECNDNGVITSASDTSVVADTDTVSGSQRSYSLTTWKRWCAFPPHIIPPCPFPYDYTCVPSTIPADDLCSTDAYVNVTMLEPACVNPLRTPAIISTERGRLNHANIDATTAIRYRSSLFDVPHWDVDVVIGAGMGWQMVDISEQTLYGRIEMRAVRDDGAGVWNAYRMWSDDKGATWNPIVASVLAPELVMAATQTRVRSSGASKAEVLMEINFVPDSGTSGPGTLVGRVRGPEATTFGTPFTLKKWNGTTFVDLRSDGSGFDFYRLQSNTGRWVLVLVQDGDVAETFWMSADRGATWLQST